jgi:ribosomal protein S18 acetylase RimI-like enzyme
VSDPRAAQWRGLRDFLRWMGGGGRAARYWEAPGVAAAIVPATPERSIVNSVAYESESALAAAYDEIAGAYDEAGVAAWSVWTPDHDSAAIELLRSRGHAFDGEPAAMTLDMREFDRSPGDLDWDSRATFEELGRLNDVAYGTPGRDGVAAAMAGAPDGLPIRLYRALLDGETASVLATIDHDDDLGIYFVATPEARRGRGLASRLMTAALLEGRERGLRTSSLQASGKGEPVYERLGYRRHFRLHLYERRG